jgi:phosphatidate phosphatase APP1
VPAPGNPNRYFGSAILVPEEGVIVVSDIDNTIKDTTINNKEEAKANTFLRPFAPARIHVISMPRMA